MPRLLSNKSPNKISQKQVKETQERIIKEQEEEKRLGDLEKRVSHIMKGGRRDYCLWQLAVASGDYRKAKKYYDIMKENKFERDEERFTKRMKRLDSKFLK